MLCRSKTLFFLLCMLTLFVALPAAAADFGLRDFEVRGGVIFPSDWDDGYLVGAAVNIGEITSGLYLYPGLAYSNAEETVTFGIPGLSTVDIDLEVTSLAVGAEVRYFLADEMRGLYFGGGPYVHFLDRELAVAGRRSSVSTQELGASGVAGYRLSSGGRSSVFAEARYTVVTDFDSAQLLLGISF